MGWAKAQPEKTDKNKDRVMILFMIKTSVLLLDEDYVHLFIFFFIKVFGFA